MRALEINKRLVYYAERTGETESDIGEIRPVYSEPLPLRIVVQCTKSAGEIAAFGKASECAVKLISDKPLGITPDAVFWIDTPTSEPHDYVMAGKPVRTVNGCVYRLKEAEVAYADQGVGQ